MTIRSFAVERIQVSGGNGEQAETGVRVLAVQTRVRADRLHRRSRDDGNPLER